MGRKQMNSEDLMLSCQNIRKTKYYLFCVFLTALTKFHNVDLEDNIDENYVGKRD